ncbi:MAG TPA: penicillin-binding protein 2, partial [Candidatus Dormibacteraeota bacterium]|nr:penicillin-binding protein 2 [Candidatus Dormibacteraeota bacterium]
MPSSRGLIYDRNGTVLVTNVPSFSVKIRPADLPLTEREAVLERLAGLLSMDVADITATLDSNVGSRFDLVRIARDVPETTARVISENHDQLPGVEVVVEARRSYPQGPLVSQILGYTGPIDAQQLADLKAVGYQPDDMLGKAGVEATYESYLRGVYGKEEVERDAKGQKLQVLQTLQQAQAGDSLELSIDTKIQGEAEQALKWAMGVIGNKRGVVAVMNPQTGEILALVSLPTYDNNMFARGISAKDYQALLKDQDQPLLDHAISDNYPPGSTYKIVAGTGGLADKKIGPHTELLTKPYLTIGTTKFVDWNHRGFGMCDIYCGFAHSSDTFFYQVAGRLGIDRLGYWAKQYGFGKPTGIDLPGEVSGTVPDNQWKMNTMGQPIYPGEVYQAGIGQGYDVVTPIQLLDAYAALANGGKVLQPQVVRRVIGPDGQVVRDFKPIVSNTLPLDPSVLKTMREAARNVLLVRHTYNLVDLPIVIAAKTGTAEFGLRDSQGRLPFHSWFAGFVAGKAAKT